MPAMPALDSPAFTTYSETEQNMYHSYPFWLTKYVLSMRKYFATHSDMVGKQRWTPNMGGVMRGVRKESSPHIRQEAAPRELSQVPKKDILDVFEPQIEATLKRHRFESRIFDFYPSFVDFMKDHVKATTIDIAEKLQRYEDIFVRTGIFHMSPYVFVCNRAGGEVVQAPMWDGKSMLNLPRETTEGTVGKTIAFRQSLVPNIGQPGNLTLVNAFLADSYMREEIRAAPYSGGSNKPKDNGALAGMNCLVLSNEAYNQFRFDPFVLAYKSLSEDLIHKGYTGAISENLVCKVEDLPLRMLADGTFPRPQTRELNADAYNYGETVNLSDYNQAPYEWAFLYASEGYKSIEVGPPPGEFNGSDVEPDNFKEMFWNGEIKLTKDILIPVALDTDILDGTNSGIATGWETNAYGEKMKAICQVALGLVGTQRRYVMPILFRRKRGIVQN